jgi:formylglycine-generating enzyme required for sulfatase activity
MKGFVSQIVALSRATESLLGAPFEWCHVVGGNVALEDALASGGTGGGDYQVADFAMAKYLITNAQYCRFLGDPAGYADPDWWAYSAAAAQWRRDHPNPRPTAFGGADLPRTRVSWFDSMAFCRWLAAALRGAAVDAHDSATGDVRLPTEQEWQRAALGDTGWRYPWGDQLDMACANYGKQIGRPTPVGQYPRGQSTAGIMDMVGNVWEWCITGWGADGGDLGGYTYRVIRGGAWNISNPEHLRATDRGGNSPRGQLNDCGVRCVYVYEGSASPEAV